MTSLLYLVDGRPLLFCFHGFTELNWYWAKVHHHPPFVRTSCLFTNDVMKVTLYCPLSQAFGIVSFHCKCLPETCRFVVCMNCQLQKTVECFIEFVNLTGKYTVISQHFWPLKSFACLTVPSPLLKCNSSFYTTELHISNSIKTVDGKKKYQKSNVQFLSSLHAIPHACNSWALWSHHN